MSFQTSQWQIAQASVRGKSHIDAGLPNQDALHLAISPDQTCFSLAISDGAGSARFAEEGARHFSRCIGDRLLALVHDANESRLDGSSRNRIGDQILHIIATARQELDPRGTHLRDYACNLMAVAMGPQWGLRVHLGDAVLLKSRFVIQPDRRVDYFADTQMTEQDRSEYANETHFLTQHDWTRHLIWDFLDPAGPEDMYALMTDGAGDIALANIANSTERRIFRGFFAPLIAQVLHAEPQERDQVIRDALASSSTFRLTGDDKTLALIMRKRCWDHVNMSPVIQDQRGRLPEPSTLAATSAPKQDPSPSPAATPCDPPAANRPTTPTTASGAALPHNTPPLSSLQARRIRAYSSLMGLALGLFIGLAAWPAYQAASAHWPTGAVAAQQAPAPPALHKAAKPEPSQDPASSATGAPTPAATKRNTASAPAQQATPQPGADLKPSETPGSPQPKGG